jgi:lysophospholipase L1-like esterase
VGILVAAFGALVSAQTASGRPPATDAERLLAAYEHVLKDWAGLTRYGSDDSELGPPKPGENRVVFIGDQITERWEKSTSVFSTGARINRGIDGQTTGQMLVRFRQDVVALRPRVVVIQGGSNDIAGASGPATKATIMDNIMSMADIAKANGIRVVLASVTPVCNCFSDQTSLRSPVKIADVNDALKEYAQVSGAAYLDLYSALAEGRNFKQTLTADGLLPNTAGYRTMTPLVERAIAEAIRK